MTEEMFDLCDERGRPLGFSKPRSQVHRDGDWHRAFHCWVFDQDADGDVRILLQLRAPDKDTSPDLWDVSVGGHYSAGESIEGGIREMQEELGLTVDPTDLIHAGWRHARIDGDRIHDHEVQDIYFLRRTLALDSLAPDPSEVPAVAIVPGKVLIRLTARPAGAATVAGGFVSLDRSVQPAEIALTGDRLIQRTDSYYRKAVAFSRKLARGHRPARRTWWA
jgi:isopentenyldiphosphate isomerase